MTHVILTYAEVEALKAENERLNFNFVKSHQNCLEEMRLNAKLTEQNRIMKEALEFYSGTVEKQVEIWDKSLLIERGDKAREALTKCKELE